MTDSRSRVLVSVGELRDRLEGGEDVVLLDVGAGDNERREGLPAAVPVSLDDFAGPGGGLKGARPLPDISALQARARTWGVGRSRAVVLYDASGGLQAARGWWVLRWAGLTDVRLLDGGLKAWLAAGLPLAPLQPSNRTGDVILSGGHLPVLDAEAAAQYAEEAVLIDARGKAAFEGDPVAREGGHIPGARSLPASGNLAADGRFASAQQLEQRFAPVLAGNVPIGATCGSGVSAAHDIVALATLGVEAALFVGSWSAWSADPDRPVAYGAP